MLGDSWALVYALIKVHQWRRALSRASIRSKTKRNFQQKHTGRFRGAIQCYIISTQHQRRRSRRTAKIWTFCDIFANYGKFHVL